MQNTCFRLRENLPWIPQLHNRVHSSAGTIGADAGYPESCGSLRKLKINLNLEFPVYFHPYLSIPAGIVLALNHATSYLIIGYFMLLIASF